MKKFFFISLFFLIACIKSKAQDNYIEVVVSDTMTVEPKEWFYFLYLQKRPEKEANAPITVVQKKAASRQKTIDSIRAIAQGFGGEIVGDVNNPLNFTMTPISFTGDEEPQYLSIRFTNRQMIENFVRAVNKRGDIEGRITATAHPDLPPYTDKLNARIIEKAKQKAAKLAQLADRSLGPVIMVTEVAEPEQNLYQGLFEKMLDADRTSWLPAWNNQSPDYPTDKIKLDKTLRIRFALR
ncbi:MAG: hypothetical protein ICV81_21240 [Flavisolibacter sp.]|nr:hypothetical protein [Flavisolibacter sp.]